MVMKRKDLVDQFELVVKQEIINHNKQILATNLQLKKMQETVDLLTSQYSKSISESNYRIKAIEKDVQFLESMYVQVTSNQQIEHENTIREFDELRDDFSNDFAAIEDNYIEKNKFMETFESLKICMNSYEQQLDKLRFYMQSEINSIKENVEKSIKEFKCNIDNRPSEVNPVKELLEGKINSAKVDAEGVLKELRILKKDFFIMGKEVEDLYNKLKKVGK